MDRIEVKKDDHWGQRDRPYVVSVDGELLRQKCGHKERRFGSEESARAAGLKQIEND